MEFLKNLFRSFIPNSKNNHTPYFFRARTLFMVAVAILVLVGGASVIQTVTTPNFEQPATVVPPAPAYPTNEGLPTVEPVHSTATPIKPAVKPATKSAVTFMFDDGGVSIYTEAKPVLDQYGYKGSAVIVTSFIGQPGFMTAPQIQELFASGWEVVSHGVTHSDLTTLPEAQWKNELSQSKTILQELGFTINYFVPPYGAYRADIIDYGRTLYSSIRAFESGDNSVGSSPYDIKVRQVVNTTTAVDVARWLEEGKSKGRWEVIVFHVIGDTSDDVYYTPPTVFSQMISAVLQSGVPVVSYEQGLAIFASSGQ